MIGHNSKLRASGPGQFEGEYFFIISSTSRGFFLILSLYGLLLRTGFKNFKIYGPLRVKNNYPI
ncbi:hypothetical protein [Candidatus Nitrosocosmicus franklandus]|uniref:Uncharacterized protein n=1 Tax=Candidatus Nitrosocosmicus franklandianus TaxID=1798806 RepID=A0A484IF08_9ARCH|nr:hypothetical protein [Candidatus Nitrosocosmicus franklandus]VFJ14601.1 protein of unknown function [Candidatus Nitrosocosmicus franklandus]